MVIVGGTFEVDPTQREQFIADRIALMQASRAEDGCLEYTFAPDPAQPGRVVLFERWASQDALDNHLVALRANPPATGDIKPTSASVVLYEVSGERPL